RAVVATTSDRGVEAAVALQAAGVEIAAVADARSEESARGPLAQKLERLGAEVLPGHTIVEATGRKGVAGAVLAPLAGLDGGEREYECDLVVVSGGAAP